MRTEVVKIDYPGSCITVNHYLGRRRDGGYFVKPETTVWKDEFKWLLKRLHLEDWQLPLYVTCSGWFRNWGSAPDLSNLSKVILDSIEELTGINDKNFRWHDGERQLAMKGETAYLLITLSEPPVVSIAELPDIAQDTLEPQSSPIKRRRSRNAKGTSV